MKKTFLLMTAMSFSLMSCGQDLSAADVPSLVLNAFKARFANAVDIEWEKKKDHYEADFEIGTADHEVQINPAGKILIHKQQISTLDLPEVIANQITSEYKDFKLDEADKLEKDGKIYYQVELDKQFTEKKMVFAENGEQTKAVSYWD
jgi:uncharacterized membrane protein YkoI